MSYVDGDLGPETQIIRKPWKRFEERSDTRQRQKSTEHSTASWPPLNAGKWLYMKRRKEGFAGLSVCKELSWVLTGLVLSFLLPLGLHGYREQKKNSVGSFYSRTIQMGTQN